MPLSLLHDGKNPDEGHTIFLGVRMRGCIPLEIQIPSLWVALITEMTNEEKHWLRLQELKVLDNKHLQAQQQIKTYQAWISRVFKKKVKELIFKKNDLVLAVKQPIVMAYKTKKSSTLNEKDRL